MGRVSEIDLVIHTFLTSVIHFREVPHNNLTKT